jgi:hypothetical protein
LVGDANGKLALEKAGGGPGKRCENNEDAPAAPFRRERE